MHVIYKITFLPHLNTNLPKYYIGSKYNYRGGYFGSVASKQRYAFTGDLTLRDWWKLQQQTPSNFLIEIINQYEDITPNELVEMERQVHIELGVMSEEYFNHSYATKGFCGCKRGEHSRAHIAEKTQSYWNSAEGQEKKLRLIARNKASQSNLMKSRWSDPTVGEMLRNRVAEAASKPRSDETRSKMSNARKKWIEYEGHLYHGWSDLEDKTGVTKYKYQQHYKTKQT